jgi:hypothetical protein
MQFLEFLVDHRRLRRGCNVGLYDLDISTGEYLKFLPNAKQNDSRERVATFWFVAAVLAYQLPRI